MRHCYFVSSLVIDELGGKVDQTYCNNTFVLPFLIEDWEGVERLIKEVGNLVEKKPGRQRIVYIQNFILLKSEAD